MFHVEHKKGEFVNPRLEVIKQEIAKVLGGKFKGLILFGSYARGEQGEFSDVDLLLLVDGRLSLDEKSQVDAIISRFSLESDVVITCIDYPVDFFEKYNTPFLLNVKEEGVRL